MNRVIQLPSCKPWAHWGPERLAKEKGDNPRSFARGFQMRAFSDDERMFPSFETCFANGVMAADIARRNWPVFMGVDLAGKSRPGNVIFVAALDPSTMRRYPLEILLGNWSSPETARQLATAVARHPNTKYIMVENNGYQQAIIDWIKNSPTDHSFWFKIESYTTTGTSKSNLEIGMPALEVEFKNKAWVIPADEFVNHGITCRCGWCVWRGEAKDYPLSATTDTVMAMWFCREAMNQMGAGYRAAGQGLNVGGINSR